MNPDCSICSHVAKVAEEPATAIYRNGDWVVIAMPGAAGVPGWAMMLSQRHVSGFDELDDSAAASFGPTLRRVQRAMLAATGAERIYTASLNESAPHVHIHMAPRYASMPNNAVGFAAFDLLRASSAGEIEVDLERSAQIAADIRARLADDGEGSHAV